MNQILYGVLMVLLLIIFAVSWGIASPTSIGINEGQAGTANAVFALMVMAGLSAGQFVTDLKYE